MNRHERILNRIKELAEEVRNEPFTKTEKSGSRVGWISGEALLAWIAEYESIYTEL